MQSTVTSYCIRRASFEDWRTMTFYMQTGWLVVTRLQSGRPSLNEIQWLACGQALLRRPQSIARLVESVTGIETANLIKRPARLIYDRLALITRMPKKGFIFSEGCFRKSLLEVAFVSSERFAKKAAERNGDVKYDSLLELVGNCANVECWRIRAIWMRMAYENPRNWKQEESLRNFG